MLCIREFRCRMAETRQRVHVLLTFDFEEWEGRYQIYEADLCHKTERVVDLLVERDIPATFFLDAQTTLNYPEAARLLAEGGFELALHSDYHYGVSNLSLRTLDFSSQDSKTQTIRMQNAIAMIQKVIPNFDPMGFRAPGLRWNEELYISLRKLNFLYDSSQQDKFTFQPFFKDGVVVFPVNCGDYDSGCYKIGAKYVMNNWKDNFRRACQYAVEAGEAYFLLLAHPSVSGKFKYIGMLKAMLNYMNWSNVEYMTCAELATEYVTKAQKEKIEALRRRRISATLERRAAYIEEREARVLQLKKRFEDYKAKFRKDLLTLFKT